MSECDNKTKEECDDDCTWDKKDAYCREFTDGEKKNWYYIILVILLFLQ